MQPADAQKILTFLNQQAGFEETSTGHFQITTDDFSNQVSTFKHAETDIVSGFDDNYYF